MMNGRSALTVTIAMLLAGCGAGIAQQPVPVAPTGVAADLARTYDSGLPTSLPFADWGLQGDAFVGGTSENAVIDSREALDAFVGRHPMAAPSVMDPDYFDFTRYVGVIVLLGDGTGTEMFRVTRLEETADAMVVHPTRWDYPGSNPKRPAAHFIGVPRGPKPVTIAPVEVVDTSRRPQPNPNLPASDLAWASPLVGAKWRAVPNPEVTAETIAQVAQGLRVEKRPLYTCRTPEILYRGYFTMDSDGWFATDGGRTEYVYSVENGLLLAGGVVVP